MRISQSLGKITPLFLAAFLVGIPLQETAFAGNAEGTPVSNTGASSVQSCEDFAQRQIQLADRLLQQSNYTRALKVLNSTAENCDIEPVRTKIAEVLSEWYGVVRGQGSGALREFQNVLSAQSHISAAQKGKFETRIKGHVRALIQQEYRAENFEAAYRLCRSYPSYASESFDVEYFCGSAAEEVGASSVAMSSYQWLIQNWTDNQSMASWKDIAGKLEELYFLNGHFQAAYGLARQRARRDPSPGAILSSLISARGKFLSPVMQTGSLFYGGAPSESARAQARAQIQRVNFPKYVKAFYIIGPDGTVERGMYGQKANQPSNALLEKATGTVSLLQSTGESNRAWLVSPIDGQFLILEFGVGTTPEETVRLETVYKNIESDKEWEKLYDLEFEETGPAVGSAVGSILNGASSDDQDLSSYDAVFDDSSLLTYYCIQNDAGEINGSYNFDRADLGYGDSEWQRTSNTPALYHHSITYDGQSVREVVWPKFVDETWTGVVRVGLSHS